MNYVNPTSIGSGYLNHDNPLDLGIEKTKQ